MLKYQEGLKNGVDDPTIMYPFTSQLQQLIRAVIFSHKIQRFHNDLNELEQEAMVEVYASFKRFNADKGSAFNYFSFVTKQHLKNWTQTKNKKDWKTSEYNDIIYTSNASSEIDDQFAFEDMLSSINISPELEVILQAIIDVISTHKIYNKRDIIKYLTQEGYQRKDINTVFKKLSKHFDEWVK